MRQFHELNLTKGYHIWTSNSISFALGNRFPFINAKSMRRCNHIKRKKEEAVANSIQSESYCTSPPTGVAVLVSGLSSDSPSTRFLFLTIPNEGLLFAALSLLG